MSADDKSKSRKKKDVGGIKIKNVFQLDPNVEVFNRQSTRRAKRCLFLSKSSAPVGTVASSDEELARSLESSSGSGSKAVDGDDATPSKSTASSSNDGASDPAALSGASPSRRRFEPPFKTPPSASASSSWIASTLTSNEAMTQ